MVTGRVWGGSGQIRTRTLLFFLDPDPDLDPKGLKFSDPDMDPTDLTGLGSLMGLIQSLLDLSKLNLFRVFLYFCITIKKILRIQNNYQVNKKTNNQWSLLTLVIEEVLFIHTNILFQEKKVGFDQKTEQNLLNVQ